MLTETTYDRQRTCLASCHENLQNVVVYDLTFFRTTGRYERVKNEHDELALLEAAPEWGRPPATVCQA